MQMGEVDMLGCLASRSQKSIFGLHNGTGLEGQQLSCPGQSPWLKALSASSGRIFFLQLCTIRFQIVLIHNLWIQTSVWVIRNCGESNLFLNDSEHQCWTSLSYNLSKQCCIVIHPYRVVECSSMPCEQSCSECWKVLM